MNTFAETTLGELSGAATGARMGESYGLPGALIGGALGAAAVGSQAGQQAGDYLDSMVPNEVKQALGTYDFRRDHPNKFLPDSMLPKIWRKDPNWKPQPRKGGKPYGGAGWFGDGPW
jgi:uncharacterized membrane protein